MFLLLGCGANLTGWLKAVFGTRKNADGHGFAPVFFRVRPCPQFFLEKQNPRHP